ncbi:Tigger transposable element-derived protein 4 [Trichinella papuae]|uniref:Tigger transposable element-derived protein 4 n=1 Tax=Trichinella papuae TaxID=268474 RepID=A0A0V1MPU3_9BILA|nr:Tigger transposable element-derived protein 4 [Trichinella papuae]
MSQRTKRVAPSRKLKTLSIGSKIELLDALMSKKRTRKELAAQYGNALSTISRIVKNKKEIQAHQLKNLDASKQRFCKRRFDMIDRAVDVWFMQMKSKSAVITGPMILEAARTFVQKLKIVNFSASTGWLDGWKKRRNIVCLKFHGEKADADNESGIEWSKNALPCLLGGYEARNIFKVDESGLFYKALPNHMLAVKGSSVCGGKTVKNHLIVVFFAIWTVLKNTFMEATLLSQRRCPFAILFQY